MHRMPGRMQLTGGGEVSHDPGESGEAGLADTEARLLYAALIDAWNRRDAGAFAAQFTADATLIGFDGSKHSGRPEVAADLAAIFGTHKTPPYVTHVRGVSAIAPGVAILEAAVGMVPPGKTELDPNLNALQCMVAVQTPDGWRIALFQNTPAAFHGRPDLVAKFVEELGG
jgi:uncharacterized protein (TIGR02246 family)